MWRSAEARYQRRRFSPVLGVDAFENCQDLGVYWVGWLLYLGVIVDLILMSGDCSRALFVYKCSGMMRKRLPVLSEESIQKVVNALGCSKARAKTLLYVSAGFLAFSIEIARARADWRFPKLNDNDADQTIVLYKYVRRRPDSSF